MDPGITARIRSRVRDDFGDQAEEAIELLELVESGNQDRERVIAAVVLGAQGDLNLLIQLIEMSHQDWRDALVNGGLGHSSWRQLMDERLGPSAGS